MPMAAVRNTLRAAFLGSFLLATSLLAQSGTAGIEERLKALEASLAALQKENASLRQQIGADTKAPAAYVRAAGNEKSLRIGGFIHYNGEFGGAPDSRYVGIKNRFFLRRARVVVSGAFAEHFDFKIENDFGAATTSERTGASGQLTDVFVNWNRYPAANVKFGQFKSPFGYEQILSDTKVITVERALPNDRLTDSRQIGLGLSGSLLQDRLSYSVAAFNGTGVNTSANDNSRFMWAGRVITTVVSGKVAGHDTKLNVGVNGLLSRDSGLSKSGFGFDAAPGGSIDNLFHGRRQSIGIDAQLRAGLLGLDAEYLRAEFHPTNRIPYSEVVADGWSILGTWFLIPKTLQAIVRYETFDPLTRTSGNESDTWTLGFAYYVKGDDVKFVFNYLLGDPAGITTGRHNRLLSRVQVAF